MKKIIFAVTALGFFSSLCFAQTQAVSTPPVSKVSTQAVETKIFSGKVESVILADAAKGTKSEITVVDETGKKLTFSVKSTAMILDANKNSISLDKIQKDGKIKIKYTTKDGAEEAVSIRVI